MLILSTNFTHNPLISFKTDSITLNTISFHFYVSLRYFVSLPRNNNEKILLTYDRTNQGTVCRDKNWLKFAQFTEKCPFISIKYFYQNKSKMPIFYKVTRNQYILIYQVVRKGKFSIKKRIWSHTKHSLTYTWLLVANLKVS